MSRTALVILAVLAVLPLALIPHLFLSHDVVPKALLLLAGAASLLLLKPLEAPPILFYLVAAQCVSLAVSTALSAQPALALTGTVWRRFGSIEQLAILVLALSVSAIRLPNLPRVFSLTAACAAIYGISQFLGFDPFLNRGLYFNSYLNGLVRPPSTLGHAIYFAAYLVPVTVLALYGALHDAARPWRRLHAIAALLGTFAIVCSGSRGALLALSIASVYLFLQLPRRPHPAWLAAVLVPLAVFALSPPGANLRHRITQWRQDPGGTRLGVWKECLPLIAAHPLFGTGPETFAAEFRLRQSVQLSRAYPDHYHETPHNIFLDAASAQGLIGFVVLVAVFLTAWRGASPAYRGALLGFGIAGLFASFTLVTALYFWVLAGLSLAGPRSSKVPSRLPGLPVAALFLLTAGILALQDAGFARLQTAADRKDNEGARHAYARAASYPVPGYHLWASRRFAALSLWPEAKDAAAHAERIGEEPFSAVYQSALLAMATGDVPSAEIKSAEAVSLAPNWAKPHLLRAQILQSMNKIHESQTERKVAALLMRDE